MLRSTKSFLGYSIRTLDGEIGNAADLLFDDRKWTARYLVVDTGGWLAGRQVLISPAALGRPEWEDRRFPVDMKKEQVEGAPPLDRHAPVSHQYEREYARYYGYPLYWLGSAPWGAYGDPRSFALADAEDRADPQLDEEERHLRSFDEITGYAVRAGDDKVGRVEDLLVDDETWSIGLVVVDTGGWLRHRRVVVPPAVFDRVDWAAGAFHAGADAQAIENAPHYDPNLPMNAELEVQLYDFTGRPRP